MSFLSKGRHNPVLSEKKTTTKEPFLIFLVPSVWSWNRYNNAEVLCIIEWAPLRTSLHSVERILLQVTHSHVLFILFFDVSGSILFFYFCSASFTFLCVTNKSMCWSIFLFHEPLAPKCVYVCGFRFTSLERGCLVFFLNTRPVSLNMPNRTYTHRCKGL